MPTKCLLSLCLVGQDLRGAWSGASDHALLGKSTGNNKTGELGQGGCVERGRKPDGDDFVAWNSSGVSCRCISCFIPTLLPCACCCFLLRVQGREAPLPWLRKSSALRLSRALSVSHPEHSIQ